MKKELVSLSVLLLLCSTLTGCGLPEALNSKSDSRASSDSDTASDTQDAGSDTGTDTADTAAPASDDGIVIQLADWETVEWEEYSDAYVSMKIPKGWEVSNRSQGIFLIYRVSDPEVPAKCWYFSEETDTAYHTKDMADEVKENNHLSYDPLVMSEGTTKAYFEAFWANPDANVTEFTVTESMYNGQSDASKVTESYNENGNLNAKETDNSSVHAFWTQNGTEGEGIYSCSVINYDIWIETLDYSKYKQSGDINDLMDLPKINRDMGFYKIYSKSWMTSPRDDLENWVPVYQESMKSLTRSEQYWKDFNEYWSAVFKAQQQAFAQQQQALAKQQEAYSSSVSDSSDIMFDAWKRRQESEDIINQKRSDSILGYERVYDTETGDIYKADSGFMDAYDQMDGKRYAAATDEMYTQGYKGYIEFSTP